ncbi:MAG: hypothetical protein AB199_02155 [Parcubacteria bacterium C7867-004]|nr:MAG: hypothetical protein AB199_02155 [Parcubacteria bacterium C7867-004]
MSPEGKKQSSSPKEGLKELKISLVQPEDFEGILEVQYKAALKNYPNDELGITADDIDADYVEARTPEKIREGEERWRNLPENLNQRYFVAKSGGKVVGFCVVDRYEDKNQVNGIYIDPDFQGQGLGKKFWEEAAKFLDPSKDTVVMVLPYNTQAKGFYATLGFEETGNRANDGDGTQMKSGAVMPVPIEMVRKSDAVNPHRSEG